jgi:hypothetical protein
LTVVLLLQYELIIRTNNNTQATAVHTASSYPIYYEAKESLISQQVSQNRRQ